MPNDNGSVGSPQPQPAASDTRDPAATKGPRARLLAKLADWLPSAQMGDEDPEKAGDTAKAQAKAKMQGAAPKAPTIKVPVYTKEF